MTLLQAIDTRTSVRTFDGSGLDAAARGEIEGVIARAPSAPGGTAVRFVVVDPRPAEGGIKVGTYGVIRGAAAFIVPVAATAEEGEDRSLFDVGFVGEAIVLELTRLGYGTCWLGGTLRKDEFAAAAAALDGETVRAVIALGRPADKRSFIESLIRGAAKSAARLPSPVLFHDASIHGPVEAPCERCSDEEIESEALRLLAAVRRAPSASNKQPFRVAVSGTGKLAAGETLKVDLFLQREDRYNALSGYAIQTLDSGIAAAHLELAAGELGLKVERRKAADATLAAYPEAAFVAGWNFARS